MKKKQYQYEWQRYQAELQKKNEQVFNMIFAVGIGATFGLTLSCFLAVII